MRIQIRISNTGLHYHIKQQIVLYSQTKGVKQKHIQCISGLVEYRQYIYSCSSQVGSHLAHGGESSIPSWAPLAWLRPPGWPSLQVCAAALG